METTGNAKLGLRFSEALEFAHVTHRCQLRKNTDTPYVAHALAVASLVLEDGGDEDEAIAALLHDAVEDGGGAETADEIRRRFGDRVAAIVDGCTDTGGPERSADNWRARREAHIEELEGAEPSVLKVYAADKLHNARDTLRGLRAGKDVFSGFNAGRDEQLWYYRELLRVFKDRGVGSLAEELQRTLNAIEALQPSTPPQNS
jgi:GTP pyrophosphokinase